MNRLIAVVTGTRAEFGLLKNLIRGLFQSENFEVKLLVTGSHLSKEHGNTVDEILKEEFKIFKKVDINLESDSSVGISNSTSIAIKKFSLIYEEIKPDLLLVLGDRYEILASVIPAVFANIPIAHIGGGEITEGAIDDSIRHSITKFSHIHFVSNEFYKQRVIQLGENPKNVFNVGGLGVDSINETKLLTRRELEDQLEISFSKKNFLITYHPETLSSQNNINSINEILKFLSEVRDTTLIFTLPNADKENSLIAKRILKFVDQKSNSFAFKSLGQRRYFSLINTVDIVIGNSSSGLLEVPYFFKPSINIGNRQKGRLKPKSVIDCKAEYKDLEKAINKAFSDNFKSSMNPIDFIYGSPGASKRILNILNNIEFSNLINKKFYKK